MDETRESSPKNFLELLVGVVRSMRCSEGRARQNGPLVGRRSVVADGDGRGKDEEAIERQGVLIPVGGPLGIGRLHAHVALGRDAKISGLKPVGVGGLGDTQPGGRAGKRAGAGARATR